MLGLFLLPLGDASSVNYRATVVSVTPTPVISFVDGTSRFQQAFNPAWVEPSAGTANKRGLLVRSQNCSECATQCCHCAGTDDKASRLAFAQLLSDDGADVLSPKFSVINGSTVPFGPHDDSDQRGTEDPRIAFDPSTGIYYMFYTAWSKAGVTGLSLATTKDPTSGSGWQLHGSLWVGKSAALHIRPTPPHYLIWGEGVIRIAESNDPLKWTQGDVYISARKGYFDSALVEAGPPPLKLSTGDYVFFYNSHNEQGVYQPGWIVFNGSSPRQILARSDSPLLTNDFAWERGVAPYTCNVPNVIFLEAAHAVGQDTFRVYLGGADAHIGAAVIKFTF